MFAYAMTLTRYELSPQRSLGFYQTLFGEPIYADQHEEVHKKPHQKGNG